MFCFVGERCESTETGFNNKTFCYDSLNMMIIFFPFFLCHKCYLFFLEQATPHSIFPLEIYSFHTNICFVSCNVFCCISMFIEFNSTTLCNLKIYKYIYLNNSFYCTKSKL